MATLDRDDLRGAVASGVVTEAQAASLLALAQSKAGYRSNMADEDEPFEFFRGFSEIFVAVGLGILFAGLASLALFLDSPALIPIVGAIAAWLLSEYFARVRRMSLPSILLAIAFAGSILWLAGSFWIDGLEDVTGEVGIFRTFVAGFIAMLLYFLRFRLPFTMFIVGLMALGIIISLAGTFNRDLMLLFQRPDDYFLAIFDITSGSRTALATLGFGIGAFVVAMAFDMRDPHRISRYAASGFWLHVLAAPAIVNTVTLTLFNLGTPLGYALTVAALLAISILALVIDRRSFLTAGIIYMALLLGMALRQTADDGTPVLTLLVLGVFITALGTWWTQIRRAIMRALPNFPLKNRLPPYADGLAVPE